MQKNFGLIVAPAEKLDENRIEAFLVKGSDGVILDKGVRHFIPYPVDSNADCIIVFKQGTGANGQIFK